MKLELTPKTFTLYAAQNYYNPTCIDSEEFFDDIKRFKYVKRLLNRYRDTQELSERLILNHLIVIFNCWGFESGVEMLALKIEPEHWSALKPFLIFLKALEGNDLVGIDQDMFVVDRLRNL
jgi:hypothetical protein